MDHAPKMRGRALSLLLVFLLFNALSSSDTSTPKTVQAQAASTDGFLFLPFKTDTGDWLTRMYTAFDHHYPDYTCSRGITQLCLQRGMEIAIWEGEIARPVGWEDLNKDGKDDDGKFACYLPGSTPTLSQSACGYVSGYEGVTGESAIFYDGHDGYDWGLDKNSPILAAAPGIVTFVGTDGEYGRTVEIDHQNGYTTRYSHLLDDTAHPENDHNPAVNSEVKAGDQIGVQGCTGNCKGDHLHFRVYHNGKITDPFGWGASYVNPPPDPLVDYNGETSKNLWYGGTPRSVGEPPKRDNIGMIWGAFTSSYHGGPGTLPPDGSPTEPPPPACSTGTGISLYTDINYSGGCKTFDVGEYSSLGDFGLDQNVSSISDPNGDYHVTFFDQPNLSGTPGYFDSSVPEISGYWDNRARSMRVERRTTPKCDANDQGPTFYTDANYQGDCFTIPPGIYPDISGFGLNAKISSIRNPGSSYAVFLNDQTNFSGQPAVFDQDVPDLNQFGWNDRALSIKVERHADTSCSPGANGVTLYRDVNFGTGGGCLSATSDIPDLTPLTYERAISSLRLTGSYVGSYQILLYRQPNYQDLCGTYWQDQSDLLACNDQAMSLQIRPFTPPTPVPTLPGTLLAGNIAPQAYLSPSGAGAVVDGDLGTEWVGGHGAASTLALSWAAPVGIHRVVVWDRSQSATDNNQQNTVTLQFSDGTSAVNVQMSSGGARCADITFPAKALTWVEVLPWDSSGNNGYREVEVWATTGPQYSNNTCVNPQSVTPTDGWVVAPPSPVATPLPTLPPSSDLVVSTNGSESSDGIPHDASNPFLIPLDAQYNNVTIKPGAYASAARWDGTSGGVVRFTAAGTVRVDGVLTMDGLGYRGGAQVQGASSGIQGESYPGLGKKTNSANGGGGGGGAGADSGGGGGGYGTAGGNAVNGTDIPPAYGGNVYGAETLSTLYLGSGGGSAGAQSANVGGAGGAGGGAIQITAGALIVTGRISANGVDGGSAGASGNQRGGGGGSGGSIFLHAGTLQVGSSLVTALGGHGGFGIRDNKLPASGGDGGAGRIRLEYQSLSGSTNPPASAGILPTPTATNSPTATNTTTPTATASATATDTPTLTATFTPTPTDTPVPTATFTPTPTDTQVPTATFTPTPTDTPVPTATFTPTPTGTPTPAPSATNAPAATSAPAIANLLLNGGFELDANADGRPDTWSADARFTRSSEIAPFEGTYTGRFLATNNSGATVRQTVPVTAGSVYRFAGRVNIVPAAGDKFSFSLQVVWKTSKGKVIRTDTMKSYSGSTSGAWDAVAVSLTSPAGASSADVQMTASSLQNTRIYVDAIAFGK